MERLGWVLVHFIWQGVLIGILTWFGLALLKKTSAQSRYLFLCGSLFICLLTPCVTWSLLDRNTHHTVGAVTVLEAGSFEPQLPSNSLIISATAVASTVSSVKASVFSFGSLDRAETTLKAAIPYFVILWSIGVIFLSLRILYGWLQLQHLCASGVPVRDRVWLDRLNALSEKLGIGRSVCLLESLLIEVPTVIGWLRPVILVPATFLTGLPAAQIEAILAHELAHIRRHDYFANLIQIAVETLLFYHPVVWLISRTIREERENCCDDLALEIVGDKAIYVTALTSLEESRSLPMAITMSATGGSLLQRIRRILGAERRNGSSWLVALTILAIAAITGSVFWEAKQHAKDEKKPPMAKPPMQVEIQARYLVVPQNTVEKLGLPEPQIGDSRAIGLTGIFLDEQIQPILHAVNQRVGTELLTAQKVTVITGHKANITILHDVNDLSLGTPQKQGGGTNPEISTLRPLWPGSQFDGVRLDAVPTVGANRQTIALNLTSKVAVNGMSFGVDSQLTAYDGNTIVFGGRMPGDDQKDLFLFVTVRVLDPTGKLLKKPVQTLEIACGDISAGMAVAGASVKAEWPDHSTNLTTDSNGVASITLPDGRLPYLSARVQKEGFVPKIIEWRLDQPSFQLPGEFFLNMEKAQSIGGFVKNEEGQPVENAKVVLIIRGSSMGVSQQVFNDLWERRVTTDKEGKWHFDEAPSDLHSLSVTLEHPDYISNERIDPLPSDDDFKQQKAVLIAHNGVPVDGTVTDEKGQPISGVDVTFGEAGSDSASYPSTKTDSKGHFHFNGLSIKKSYIAPILTFTSADHAPVMATLDQGSGAQSLKVTMNSGKKLQIRFVDKQGQPVRGVTLCPDTWQGHRPFGCFRFESDTYGMVVWKHAPEGPITYALLADSYLNESPTLQPSDEVQTYQLKRPTAISGRVLDAVTQKPITDYQLIPGMYFPEPNIDWIGWERLGVRQFRTDSYHYVFDRAAVMRSSPPTEGFHRIRIEAPGYEPGVSRPIANNEDSVTLDFALKPESAIHGLVTAADGSPVHNAQIVVAGYGNASRIHDGMFTDLSRQQVVTTDENGKYELPAQEEDYPIAIIQPDKGYFTTTYKELKAAPNVKLLSWGEISLTRADTGDTNRSYYVSCWKKEGPPYHAKQIFFDDDRPNTVQGNPVIFKHLTAGPVWLGIQHGLPNEGSVVQVENGKTTKVDLKTGKTGIIEPDGTIRDQGNPSAQVLGKFFPNIATTEKKGGEATNPEVKSPDASLTKTLSVQVIDQQGKPIQGASVKPTGFRTKVDHGSWWGIRPQDEHLFASGTTDAQGKISVSFPSHAGDELTTGTVIVLVQHPEACSAEVEINIDEPKPVMLVRGTKVILSAQPLPGVSFSRIEADIVDDERQARLQKWTHAPDGKSVSAHLPDGNDLVRLVGMTPQGKSILAIRFPFHSLRNLKVEKLSSQETLS
jgi:beta-lactamase regulating signal transducer with metallopeptidase domain/protocatechuate 3,4-dioxygenase beta subunit